WSRSRVTRGVAITPPGSHTATPTRTEPGSTPSRRPGPRSGASASIGASLTLVRARQSRQNLLHHQHHHRLAARSASRNAETASGTPAGLVPPPCASSGLPPPRPPIAAENDGTNLPAASPRPRAASVVATTNDTLPPSALNSATTPGRAPSRPRTSEA